MAPARSSGNRRKPKKDSPRTAVAADTQPEIPDDELDQGDAALANSSAPIEADPNRQSDPTGGLNGPLGVIKQKYQKEILALVQELTVDLPKEIGKARAYGDLRENAEYKFAKARQRWVRSRLRFLKRRMGDLCVSDLSHLPRDRAGFGSHVVLLDMRRRVEVEYRIVIAEEADAAKGMITAASPIGKALLNRKPGDRIEVRTPAGVRAFELLRLKTIYDEEA